MAYTAGRRTIFVSDFIAKDFILYTHSDFGAAWSTVLRIIPRLLSGLIERPNVTMVAVRHWGEMAHRLFLVWEFE